MFGAFDRSRNSRNAWSFSLFTAIVVLALSSPAEAGTLVGLGGKCADVEDAASADGTPVNLLECHGNANQQWEPELVAPFFRVRGLAGKCLQPGDDTGSGNPGLVIGPCDGAEDLWQPDASFPTGFTLIHMSTGMCMDVEGASSADGTRLQLFPCHGGVNQLWSFDVPPTPPLPEPGTLVGLGGKCADVEDAATADGTPVNLFECHGNANQRWQFESVAPFFRVRGLAGKCLQPGGLTGSGNPGLVIGPCDGSEDRWQPSGSFPSGFTLAHVDTGMCMDVEDASAVDGTPLQLFPCHGGANQVWDHVPVAGGCVPNATTLCLPGDNRFAVSVYFETVQGGGRMGDAQAVPLDALGIDQGGVFYFLDSQNPEFLVKVIDGCPVNNRWWVFFAATTNIGFELTVTDTFTMQTRVYTNPDIHPADAVTDTNAFATCP